MFDKDELTYLSSRNINKMTTRELRRYISRGLNFINDEDYFANEDVNILKSYSMVEEDLGTYRGRVVGRTSNARKVELIDKATDILIHLRITAMEYGMSNEDIELREQSEKAYEKLKQTFKNQDLTRQEFEDIVNTFGAFGKNVLEKYVESSEIYNIYQDVFKNGNSLARNNLEKIMVSVYNEMQSAVDSKGKKIYGGLSRDKFTDTFVDKVMEKLKDYYN